MGSFTDLCKAMDRNGIKKIYCIHEPYRESETRSFAERLREKGFEPLIAGDFRPKGKKAVRDAIDTTDLTLIVAFDNETVKEAKKKGVSFIELVGI